MSSLSSVSESSTQVNEDNEETWKSFGFVVLLNILGGVGLLILFELLRNQEGCQGMYKTRTITKFRKQYRRLIFAPPPDCPTQPLAWLVRTARFSDTEVFQLIGLDGFLVIRFCRLGFKICLFASFFGVLILMPLFAKGKVNKKGPAVFTIANLPDDSAYLWAVVALSWLFTLQTLRLLRDEYRRIAGLRSDFLIHGDPGVDPQARYTVMVENLPIELRHAAPLRTFFRGLFRDEVFDAKVASPLDQLPSLVASRDALLLQVEKAHKKRQVTEKEPMVRMRKRAAAAEDEASVSRQRGDGSATRRDKRRTTATADTSSTEPGLRVGRDPEDGRADSGIGILPPGRALSDGDGSGAAPRGGGTDCCGRVEVPAIPLLESRLRKLNIEVVREVRQRRATMGLPPLRDDGTEVEGGGAGTGEVAEPKMAERGAPAPAALSGNVPKPSPLAPKKRSVTEPWRPNVATTGSAPAAAAGDAGITGSSGSVGGTAGSSGRGGGIGGTAGGGGSSTAGAAVVVERSTTMPLPLRHGVESFADDESSCLHQLTSEEQESEEAERERRRRRVDTVVHFAGRMASRIASLLLVRRESSHSDRSPGQMIRRAFGSTERPAEEGENGRNVSPMHLSPALFSSDVDGGERSANSPPSRGRWMGGPRPELGPGLRSGANGKAPRPPGADAEGPGVELHGGGVVATRAAASDGVRAVDLIGKDDNAGHGSGRGDGCWPENGGRQDGRRPRGVRPSVMLAQPMHLDNRHHGLLADAYDEDRFGQGLQVRRLSLWRGLTFFLSGLVEGLDALLDELRMLTIGRTGSTGFVCFKTLPARAAACQEQLSDKPGILRVTPAPEPNDIIWRNITRSSTQIRHRQFVTNVLLAIGCFFWSFVVGGVQKARQWLLNNWDALKNWTEESSVARAAIYNVLPSLVILTIITLLAPIFQVIAFNYEGYKSNSQVQMSSLVRLFWYNVANVYVLITLSSIADVLGQIISDPSAIFQALGEEIPLVSVYCSSIILAKIFIGLGMELIKPGMLIVFGFRHLTIDRKVLTARTLRKGLFQPLFPFYPVIFSGCELALLIALVYQCIAPMVSIFSALFFLAAEVVYKYNLIFVYMPSFQTGGLMWPRLFWTVIVAMIAGQLALTGYIILREGYSKFGIMVPLPFLTLYFGFKYANLYNPVLRRIPRNKAILLERSMGQQAMPLDGSVYGQRSTVSAAAAAAASGASYGGGGRGGGGRGPDSAAAAPAAVRAEAWADFSPDLYTQPALRAVWAEPELVGPALSNRAEYNLLIGAEEDEEDAVMGKDLRRQLTFVRRESGMLVRTNRLEQWAEEHQDDHHFYHHDHHSGGIGTSGAAESKR